MTSSGQGPPSASRVPYLRFNTSFHYCVIYIKHMVLKVITIYGQPYGFQCQPYGSRSTIRFKVNHGSRSTVNLSRPILLMNLVIRNPKANGTTHTSATNSSRSSRFLLLIASLTFLSISSSLACNKTTQFYTLT